MGVSPYYRDKYRFSKHSDKYTIATKPEELRSHVIQKGKSENYAVSETICFEPNKIEIRPRNIENSKTPMKVKESNTYYKNNVSKTTKRSRHETRIRKIVDSFYENKNSNIDIYEEHLIMDNFFIKINRQEIDTSLKERIYYGTAKISKYKNSIYYINFKEYLLYKGNKLNPIIFITENLINNSKNKAVTIKKLDLLVQNKYPSLFFYVYAKPTMDDDKKQVKFKIKSTHRIDFRLIE